MIEETCLDLTKLQKTLGILFKVSFIEVEEADMMIIILVEVQ